MKRLRPLTYHAAAILAALTFEIFLDVNDSITIAVRQARSILSFFDQNAPQSYRHTLI